jgi:hypothetical protein
MKKSKTPPRRFNLWRIALRLILLALEPPWREKIQNLDKD